MGTRSGVFRSVGMRSVTTEEPQPISVVRRIVSRLPGYLGTLLLGGWVISVLVSDVRFGMRAVQGTAVVLSSYPTPRSGSTVATVEQSTEGMRVLGLIEGWYWHPRNGEVLSTVYSPDLPSRPVLNSFFRRYSHLLMASTLFLIVASGEGIARRSVHKSESLDRWMVADHVARSPANEVAFID